MGNINSDILTGSSIEENFGCLECTNDKPDFTIIKNIIMNGHHEGSAVYVVRNFVNSDWCKTVSESFNKEIKKNGSNREMDGFVLTNQIGATQFSRNGQQYMEEISKVGKPLLGLLNEVSHEAVEAMFLNQFLEENFMDYKVHFGPARFKNSYSSFATFRRWLDNGLMSLMPHEDLAQLEFAKEDGFEIKAAKSVTSFNVCLEASAAGGELMIWNFIPDDECREKLGVTKTGYPYQPDKLDGIESVAVRLNQGDVYFMNASHLHGVKSTLAGSRLTAGRFIGKISDTKVVFWT
jgi:hypothetical protein